MNRFSWLVRRELWEHRAIWMAPAVVLAVLLLGAVTGYLFIGDVVVDARAPGAEAGTTLSSDEIAELRYSIEHGKLGEMMTAEERREALEKLDKPETRRVVGPAEALSMVPQAKQVKIVTLFYAAVAMLVFLVMGTIAFFYSLDSLYSERRDRSVLFWKSLPLSDAETVLAKFFTAAVAIPVIAAVAAVLAQLIAAAGAAAKVAMIGGDPTMLWNPAVLGAALSSSGLIAVVSVLWYAPLVAYLLIVSAWAPRSPFLWAALPPVAIVMLEKIALGTVYVKDFLAGRFLGPLYAMARDGRNSPDAVVTDTGDRLSFATGAPELVGRALDFVISPEMLLGLVGAAALLAAAIWGRRYREENT